MKQRVLFELHALLLAVQFLTRIPVQSAALYSDEKMAASPRYYPLVGLLLGGISAGIYFAASMALSPLVSTVLATALVCLLTGAFHEDGLADCFDGVGGGLTKERALEIMKDSRIGTYGTAALVFVLGLKITLLASLPVTVAIAAFIAAHALSRVSSVIVIATSRYVRLEGTGKYTSSGLSAASLFTALATGAATLAALGYLLTPSAAAFCVVGAAAGHAAMRLIYQRKLGGYTGDTLGAVQQVSEVGAYLGLALWL